MIWLLSRRNLPTILHTHRHEIYGLDPRSAWWGLLLRSGATLPVDMLLGGGGGSVRLLMLARYLNSSSPILKHLKITTKKLGVYTTALFQDPIHVKGLRAQFLASGCVGMNATAASAITTLKRLADSTTTMARRVHRSIQHLRAQRLLREDLLAHACNAWKSVMSARATCASFYRLFGLESEADALIKCSRRLCNHFAPDIYPWAHALSSCHGVTQGYAAMHGDPFEHCRIQRHMLCDKLLPPLQQYVMKVLKESRVDGCRAVVDFVPATVTDARSFEEMLKAWDDDVLSCVRVHFSCWCEHTCHAFVACDSRQCVMYLNWENGAN